MDTTRAIQIVVARIDLLLGSFGVVQWWWIGLSLLLVCVIIMAIKAVMRVE